MKRNATLCIGKTQECPRVEVNGSVMTKVKHEQYLGQYVSANGCNDKNITERCNKGIGMQCQVFAMLSEISLGSYFFHIGLLLRDTNLINAVLFGAEAWYGITKKQMEEIDKIDIMFMKKLFNAKNNVAKEIYYLESGKLPAKFIIISRRLNFLRHIINSDKNGLLFKFYSIQKDCPCLLYTSPSPRD